jgi:hypothetical protein
LKAVRLECLKAVRLGSFEAVRPGGGGLEKKRQAEG